MESQVVLLILIVKLVHIKDGYMRITNLNLNLSVIALLITILPNLAIAEEPVCVQKALTNNQTITPPLKQALGGAAFNKAMASKKYSYTGNAKCRLCHRDFFIGRKGDVHDHAYQNLVAAYPEHANNPRCLSCHTTGYGVKKGFTSVKRTAKLANVQCEGCHGPGMKHIRLQTMNMTKAGLSQTKENRKVVLGGFLAGTDKPKMLKKMCKSCHTDRWKNDSENFIEDYNSYKTAKPNKNKTVKP